MRKSELVHLHALFEELRGHVTEHESVPADAFATYDNYEVSSRAIHQPKSEHKEALVRLADDVVTTVESTEESPDPSTESEPLFSS